MKVTSSNKPLQPLMNKIKRGKIVFTHRLQRREGVWGTKAKSLLIDSLLRGYPVNPVYTIIEENNGWGKLKSGIGWISLGYTKKC